MRILRAGGRKEPVFNFFQLKQGSPHPISLHDLYREPVDCVSGSVEPACLDGSAQHTFLAWYTSTLTLQLHSCLDDKSQGHPCYRGQRVRVIMFMILLFLQGKAFPCLFGVPLDILAKSHRIFAFTILEPWEDCSVWSPWKQAGRDMVRRVYELRQRRPERSCLF